MRCMYKFSFLSIILLVFTGCRHDSEVTPTTPRICFETEVLPIVLTNCAISGCHNGNEDIISINSYSDVMRLVKAGKPYQSRIFKSVTNTWGNLMPPKPHLPLSARQRTILYLWILQGAKSGLCDTISHTSDSICFTNVILPVFETNCASTGCHDAITHEEGYNLTSYARIVSRGIVPGNGLESEIYKSIIRTDEDRMPPPSRTALTAAEKASILQWINEGANNTTCTTSCDTTQFTFTAINGIILKSCVGCHSGATASSGVRLDSYSYVQSEGISGRLMDVIYQTNNRPLMPPSGSLTSCQKTQLRKWVAAGCLNN